MKRVFKFGMPALAAFVAVVAIMFYRSTMESFATDAGISGDKAPQPVPVVAVGLVEEVEDVEARRYTGQIVPILSVDLTPRISGEILDVAFEEGDRVQTGTVLYQIDSIRYEAAVKKAEAEVAECKTKVAYALVTYQRSQGLLEQKAISRDTFDNDKSNYEAALAAVQAAEAGLVTARDDLENTRIIAPITGKIGVTAYSRGNYVTPSSGVLVAIVNTDTLRVRFSMSSRDYLDMFRNETTLKQKAAVRLRLADDSLYELAGTVDLIDNRADGRSDTVTIYARFDNPEGILIPDGTVTVLLSKINGGTIPAVAPSAVMHDATSSYVYIVDPDYTVERRNVELGVSGSLVQYVKSGLAAGETVVIDGMQKAFPGRRVEPQMKNWLPEPGAEGYGLALSTVSHS